MRTTDDHSVLEFLSESIHFLQYKNTTSLLSRTETKIKVQLLGNRIPQQESKEKQIRNQKRNQMIHFAHQLLPPQPLPHIHSPLLSSPLSFLHSGGHNRRQRLIKRAIRPPRGIRKPESRCPFEELRNPPLTEMRSRRVAEDRRVVPREVAWD